MIADCGHEMTPPGESIVQAGGWCAPSEVTYDLDYDKTTMTMCSDCKTRYIMMLNIGIDPGRNGENLRVKRGGIRFPAPKERA